MRKTGYAGMKTTAVLALLSFAFLTAAHAGPFGAMAALLFAHPPREHFGWRKNAFQAPLFRSCAAPVTVNLRNVMKNKKF